VEDWAADHRLPAEGMMISKNSPSLIATLVLYPAKRSRLWLNSKRRAPVTDSTRKLPT